MTINDPKILKRASEHKAAKKIEYEKTKGKILETPISVTVCKTCRNHIGTFAKDPVTKKLVHVGCLGPKRVETVREKITSLVVDSK